MNPINNDYWVPFPTSFPTLFIPFPMVSIIVIPSQTCSCFLEISLTCSNSLELSLELGESMKG